MTLDRWASTGCFNPRAHGGRDWASPTTPERVQEFQSTRPRGARPMCLPRQWAYQPFQSTRPRGARPKQEVHILLPCVSIHAPTWGATGLRQYEAAWWLFQSTRPRGARPALGVVGGVSLPVSIHAPTGGATFAWLSEQAINSQFQSTRPRGARLLAHLPWLPVRLFQSTRPRGARRSLEDLSVDEAEVSIHAPTGGATRRSKKRTYKKSSFNPRAHGGRDLLQLHGRLLRLPFQSTRPRGARRSVADAESVLVKFQSTRPRGARLAHLDAVAAVHHVSIHAPTGGATTDLGLLL